MEIQVQRQQEKKPERLLRLWHIIGDPNAEPPIPPRIPIGRSSWWAGVANGRYPKPIKLGPATTCWLESDILKLMERGD